MGNDFNIYRDTDLWRDNFERDGKYRPNINFIEARLKDSSITRFSDFQNADPDLLVTFSFAVAKMLSNKLKPTQLRRFYHYVKNLQNKIPISDRSEEHTSELQSHSFISYAVFCLKKKKTKLQPT